ncbi:MAG: glycosyltransferase [Acidobacteria bacterium]|nr:glycosyltransferase [Acidobacteriota bacterium]
MKIGLIVQRYGTEIIGGSEYHCRLVAERLAVRHDVEVLTTCAQDYITWTNEYPEGSDRIRGVTVHRFANDRTRDIESFNEYSDWIFGNPHTADDEMEWLRQQGPWCPALTEHLKRRHTAYDALIFFTYLYAPTVLGLRIDPRRSILVPTAHDEPAIRLGIYRDVFRAPAGMAYNTGVERTFLRLRFEITATAEETVGCGVDLPAQFAAAARDPDEYSEREDDARRTSAAAFRRRHRLYEPFLLYGGRIDPGKGCEELIEHFSAYAADRGDAVLALMGVKLMRIPDEPFIRFAGLLPEAERLEALQAATAVAVPSPYESLSLLALEAFAVGTPVLANARSEVVREHCQRSNAGLYYADRDEFDRQRGTPGGVGPQRAGLCRFQLRVGGDPAQVRSAP